LFVAVSIRITYIARSQELRNRAARTLSLFGMVLIVAILVAIPRQAYRTFGAELVVLAVIAGIGLHILDLRAKGDRPRGPPTAPTPGDLAQSTYPRLRCLSAAVPGGDDNHRAVRVVGDLAANRSKQQSAEPAGAP
jgi:hypothetical protein